jgi:signal transduction histidine kinase
MRLAMNTEGVCELLSRTRLFSDFEPGRLGELVASGHVEQAPSGRVLFSEGDASESVYVVLEGAVEVFKLDTSGDEVQLNTLGAGAIFGELALFGAGRRTANVRTILPTSLFSLNRGPFVDVLAQSRAALSGTLAGMVELVLESSERLVKAVDQQRRVSAEVELQRHRSIAQMVTGVAHELNTPLGVVNSAADLVAETLTPELVEQLVQLQPGRRAALEDLLAAARMIKRNLTRADHLIESFKRLSVRQITHTPEQVSDLTTVFEEIVTLLNLRHRATRLRVRFEHALDLDQRSWYGAPGHVSQVLENLVNNAQHHAYRSGEGEVAVRLEATPSHYVVHVKDKGGGIPEPIQRRIFEPFFTTGRARGGSGLGLAIVHATVTEGLHGTIRVSSTSSEGTVFSFTMARA